MSYPAGKKNFRLHFSLLPQDHGKALLRGERCDAPHRVVVDPDAHFAPRLPVADVVRVVHENEFAEPTVSALRELAVLNPAWPGRADAMVRTAVLLDSLGRRAEAAAAYEQVSTAYPQDRRAADAAYNAAVTYSDAKDAANAARMFAAFAQRFPRDARTPEAQRLRLDQLALAGDSATAASELARLCVRPSAAMAERCVRWITATFRGQ